MTDQEPAKCRATGVLRRAMSLVLFTALLSSFSMTGCVRAPEANVTATYVTGDFGKARVALHDKLPQKPVGKGKVDRDYMLGYLRVGVLTMADGYPLGVSPVFERVYELLRLQGVNKDKGVESVALNEDLKIWKGEPFEQALAYSYIAAEYASQGSWDNVRAAASGAMFHLRDFGKDKNGQPLDTQEVVTNASKADPESDDITGYVIDESDFALGHLLNGIANQQLGRMDEARAHYKQAIAINSSLASLTTQLLGGQYNTILMVDYGRGPQKIATGPDQAISAFKAMVQSDGQPLVAQVNGATLRVPVACDVNRMALDHRWNNLEDMRQAKSAIGTGLVVAGGSMATLSNDSTVQLVGLGLMLGGAIAKAGAHADTRYCEAMPQRLYLLPVMLEPDSQVTLSVQGHAGSSMTLTGLGKRMSDSPVQFRFVRMIANGAALPWTTSGTVYYTNTYANAQAGQDLPYILGGNCVLPPTPERFAQYQQAGHLRDMSFGQLRDLYLAEEIVWEDSPRTFPGLHVLEGGKSLASPWPGTAGYSRLFCQLHQPYVPHSDLLKDAIAKHAKNTP